MTHEPERLSLWDRIFNRERREVIERGASTWGRPGTTLYDRSRQWVEHRVIDRLTGSERIEREYLT